MASADVMFARKIWSVFDKLIPQKPKPGYSNEITNKHCEVVEKVIYCMYQNNKTWLEIGTIEKTIGNMVYLVKGQKFVHKRHQKPDLKKKRHSNVEENNRADEEPIDIMFNTFDMPAPQTAPEVRRQSKRKQIATEIMELNPKRKKKWLIQSKSKKWGVVVPSLFSIHNGLFP